MSFSFGFSGDDIDNEDTDLPKTNLKNLTIEDSPTSISPSKWIVRELCECLPSQISYNTLRISPEDGSTAPRVHVFRRSLFDIRAQLMAEANPDENDNDKLLTGLDAGDLRSGQYEGGFKTWECAVDLAKNVASLQLPARSHIIELGAGSAIPSLVLLQAALRSGNPDKNLRFTFCDYNEDVLKLCTMPNVLLNCIRSPSLEPIGVPDNDDHDLDLEVALPDGNEELEKRLQQKGITVDFISGSWGDDFVDLVKPNIGEESPEQILVLASETIYSPDSIKTFTKTVLDQLKLAKTSARALIAAKKVYFGVGGGTDEFNRCVREAGGSVKEIGKTTEAGVARVVLEVTNDSVESPG